VATSEYLFGEEEGLMRLKDGKIICHENHEHSYFSAILCESNRKKDCRERLVIPGEEVVFEGMSFRVCPAGELHDARLFDAVNCSGRIRYVRAGVDHDRRRWVVADCRHLHAESEVVQAMFCDHARRS
jgi:hypothetical protein